MNTDGTATFEGQIGWVATYRLDTLEDGEKLKITTSVAAAVAAAAFRGAEATITQIEYSPKRAEDGRLKGEYLVDKWTTGTRINVFEALGQMSGRLAMMGDPLTETMKATNEN